ncbi:unnamed protein product, partial [Heterotrigona itama]
EFRSSVGKIEKRSSCRLFPNAVTEPVATKKPKFSSDAKKSWYDRVISQDLTLFCPAQGFPVPSYSQRAWSRVPLCNSLEPVGSKAPAFTGVLKGGYMEIKSRASVVFFCPAQGYPVPSF